MATPHINAQPGDFAETVLMPGDPLQRRRPIGEPFCLPLPIKRRIDSSALHLLCTLPPCVGYVLP